MTALAHIDFDFLESDTALKGSLANFLYYASHRITDQSLPTYFDGLLPNQRRMLLAMQDLGAWPTSKFQKSSRVTATSAANYHPVGNTYDGLVNMSQDWVVPCLLTDPEGNWGPVDGDPAAAERYTEIRLSRFGEAALFADMPSKRHTTEQVPHTRVPCAQTYTEMHWEEVYFPVQVPLLLLNGSNGIAVGLAQTWQPLAYRSLLTQLRAYLAGKGIDYSALRPGYPMGARITSSQEDFITALQTGHGSIQTTAAYSLETNRAGNVTAVVFTSVPPNVTLNKVGDDFNTKVATDPDCIFSRLDNESDKTNVRLVLPLKKALPQATVLPHIGTVLRKTPLSTSQTVNMLALKDRYPVDYNLELFFKDWLAERSNIIQRVAQERLEELEAQWRRLNILVWVRDRLQEVSALLKTAANAEAIRSGLDTLAWIDTFEHAATADDVEILLGINLRQVSRLSDDEVNKRIARIKKELGEQGLLVNDAGARNKQIDRELGTFIAKAEDYGIADHACEFDPDLAAVLKLAEPRGNNVVALPTANGPAETPSVDWWATVTGKGADTDILVSTVKGALIRVSNKSVRSTPYNVNLVDPEDRIQSATFATAPMLLLLADNERLLTIPKDQLPYNQPVYPARIAQLVKTKTPFVMVRPVVIASDTPKELLLISVTGLARKTPLSDIPSLRSGVTFPEPIATAALVSDTAKGTAALDAVATVNLAKIVSGSLKRVGNLGKPIQLTNIQRSENGMAIALSEDRKAIYKAS